MAYPTFADKVQFGDYKTAPNAINAQDINQLKHGFDGLPTFMSFNTYANMVEFLPTIGVDDTVYYLSVRFDETLGGVFGVYNYCNGRLTGTVQQDINF